MSLPRIEGRDGRSFNDYDLNDILRNDTQLFLDMLLPCHHHHGLHLRSALLCYFLVAFPLRFFIWQRVLHTMEVSTVAFSLVLNRYVCEVWFCTSEEVVSGGWNQRWSGIRHWASRKDKIVRRMLSRDPPSAWLRCPGVCLILRDIRETLESAPGQPSSFISTMAIRAEIYGQPPSLLLSSGASFAPNTFCYTRLTRHWCGGLGTQI